MECNIEKMSVVEQEGIEFYVNSKGTKSGMSQKGLARFCGVHSSAIVRLLRKINGGDPISVKEAESLTDTELKGVPGLDIFANFVGDVFFDNVETENNAKVVKSHICEAVVYYYGYIASQSSSEVKSTSRHSHRKFAQIGLHEWIKKTVGVIEKHDTDELKALMGQILCKMDSLERVTTEYKAIREKTTVHYVGMDQLLTDLQKEQNNLLEPTEDGSLSLEGYLYKNGITLSRSKFKSLAIMVGQSYKSLTGTEPDKAHFSVNGKKKYNVFGYKPIDFPMLNMCLTKVIAGQF